MFKKIGILLCAVLIFAAAAQATAPRKGSLAPKSTPYSSPSIQAIKRTPHTPLERYLLPALQKRLAAKAVKSRVGNSESTGISAAIPNWGGFLSPVYYPARLESSCIADPYNCGVAAALAADVNQDGKQDIVVLQYDGTLNVLLGNGSGFATPVPYSNPNLLQTEIAQAFAVDVNNDGYPDVVALDQYNNALLVYLNLKNGTFGTPTPINLPYDFGSIAAFALGDVNGDGKLDAVTVANNINSYSSSTVTVQTYLGGGDGTFQMATTALTQTVSIPTLVQFNGNLAVTLGDLNKDGKLDIAVVMEEYTQPTVGAIVATAALGHGDGTFGTLNVTNPVSVPYTATDAPFLILVTSGVQILDVNGDSNPDLLVDVAGTSSALMTALGDGSGGFSSLVQTPNAGGAQQIVYADVNGDGIPDMIENAGLLQVWTGKGDGTFQIAPNGSRYIEDGGPSQSLGVGDFNGDGSLDIVQLGGDYKQLSLFAGNGKGAFNGAPALASTTDATPDPFIMSLADVADVQGKGFTSALYIDYSGNLPQVVTGVSDGKGNFTYSVGLTSSAAPMLDFLEPVQVDFNGDGKQDLLIVGTDGSLSAALSNGDGTFAALQKLTLPALNCVPGYAATGDLNGDGKSDLVLTYVGDAACGGTGGQPSGYFTALGNGDGTFQTPVFTAYGTELYSVTLADMNLDGKLDLLLDDAPFQIGGTFAIDLLPGNGDGTFAAGTAINSNYLVSQVIAGDYNGDGKPDLILLEEGEDLAINDFDATAGVLLIPGRGDGTFGEVTQIGTGNFFLNGSLTDVNGDGQPDLVLSLYNSPGQPNSFYGLSTLLGEGGGAFSSPINTLQSLDSVSPFPGNFFNDNAPDFIVATAYGTALYLGQGGTSFTLSDSASSITFGQAETFTATVAASMVSRPSPSGTVSFYDGTTLLASVALSGGSAAYATSALTTGSHSITAAYSGDANFNPNTSSTTTQVTVAALTPAFTLTTGSPTLSLTQGQTGVATLTLTANAAFSGVVALTCSGSPANASCSVNPASVTLAPGGSSTATLVITTTTSKAALEGPASPWQKSSGTGSPLSLSLAAVGLFAGWKWRKRWPMLISLLVLGISGLAISACGGSSPVSTAAKGSYTITVTATPSGGSGSAQSATVAVTVQ